MRVGIYAGATNPAAGGAHTLLETIKRDIAASPRSHETVFFFEDANAEADLVLDGIRFVNVSKRGKLDLAARIRRKTARMLGKIAETNGLNALLLKEGIDLLWILGPYSLNISVPYIFTVWDLGHRVRPCFPELNTMGWTWEARERTYQKMLYRATFVIAGNEEGKREILDNYPMTPEKIAIVPFPIPDACRQDMAIPVGIDGIEKPFIFYPAQFWSHKNHTSLVEAIRYLRDEKGKKVNCYFVGSDKGNRRHVEARIRERGLENQVRALGFVDDATLRYLYKNALAMAFVSLLGPNNLPPFEAAALGCPLIISDLRGHREQMGDAALYVDATDAAAVGDAIALMAADDVARASFIQKGYALAESMKDYSYYGEVEKLIESYARLRDCWE